MMALVAFPTIAADVGEELQDIPNAGDWVYEIKLDGYRLMTRFASGKPALITRNGHDWSAKMPVVVRDLTNLGIESGWLDGEVVVLRDGGVPDFNALQNAFDRGTGNDIVYFLFDVPFFEGYDLRQATLRDRRRFLESFLRKEPRNMSVLAPPSTPIRGRSFSLRVAWAWRA